MVTQRLRITVLKPVRSLCNDGCHLKQGHKSKHPHPNTSGRNKVLSMFKPSDVAYLATCYDAAGRGEDKQKGQA